MSNEAPAHEGILSEISSIDFSKPFFLSRTFWVNVIALLALFFPAVREWAAAEPEAPIIILAFVNLVLRTVTNKSITISKDDGDTDDGKSSGGFGGLPLALMLAAAIIVVCLPACSGSGYPLTGSITYRDAESGAKGGLVFEQGKAPRASVRVPVYDPKTGELIGVGELSGPLSGTVTPTK